MQKNSHVDADMHANLAQMMRMGREVLDGRLSKMWQLNALPLNSWVHLYTLRIQI